ncbi:tRNA glutamyl-Q(34) synthetase GluQRS [Myxococcota bacterium]|nr:tRNA glutamyl-Q(34) synthetase GluQRS [Myxococcota bacterium]
MSTNPNRYVGRFAPSPTGRMHLGVARTLLAAWLDARAHDGHLVLRIEDIDLARTVPGAADELQRDLEWLGLDWDEGPGRDLGRGPHVQSARFDRYHAAITRLEALGRVYPCSCSRKEIALASSAPHGPSDDGPRYSGKCRAGYVPRPDRTAALRLRTEPPDHVEHVDRRYGALAQDVHDAVGDFVLRRADGMWAYQLAVTVDDLEQGVTTIVRGADLLTSTPRQLLLRRLLDPSAPPLATLHVPLVLGPTGQRLAKRDGAIAIADQRAKGHTPEAVIGALAHSLGLVETRAPLRARELVERWDPAKVPLTDAKLDLDAP